MSYFVDQPWPAAPAGPPTPSTPPTAGAETTPAPTPGRWVPPQQLPPTYRYSRWAKSQTTFGPLGRIVATVLLLLPIPLLLVSAALGIGLVGVGIYGLVLLPWALRHVWAAARLPG